MSKCGDDMNKDYGKVIVEYTGMPAVDTISMGDGSVLISVGGKDEYGFVVVGFHEGSRRPVGTIVDFLPGTKLSDIDPLLFALRFDNPKTIDTLIKQLQGAKKHLLDSDDD